MKNLIFFSALLMCSLASFASLAVGTQSHAQIKNVAAAFVEQQIASLSGEVTYKIEDIDQRIAMPACDNLEAFLPPGSQLIGKTAIGVRCPTKNGWSIFIPVQIKIRLQLLISAQQLPLGHTLVAQDFTVQSSDASQKEGLTDPNMAIGKVLRYSIAAGQVIREDMLRAPFVVTQGQVVQLLAQGEGFNIRNEGTALANASEGQTVQVRIGLNRVVNGIARTNGTVEVAP
jgi:flagella basal body P-ring formation protein FlgA